MSITQELAPTIEEIKHIWSDSGPAEDPDNTVYSLKLGARLLFPVISPLRNCTERMEVAPLIGGETDMPWANHGVLDSPGGQPVQIAVPLAWQKLRSHVTLEAQINGIGQVDAKAVAVANTLRALMVEEERCLLFGRRLWPHTATDSAPLTFLDSSPMAYYGLFAQLLWLKDAVFTANDPQNLSKAIVAMALEMAEKNGAPPTLCLVNVEQAKRITRETVGDGPMRVSRLELPNYDEMIEIVSHPFLPDGEVLLLTPTIPDPIAKRLKEQGHQGLIPAPWSLAVAQDYTETDYRPTGPDSHFEISLHAAFRLHCPFLVGWIRGA